MMTEPGRQADEAKAAEVESRHPRWTVWVSDTGYWWASLHHDLSAAERRAGCVPYLRGHDLGELVELIQGQDALADAAQRSRDAAPTSSRMACRRGEEARGL